MFIEAKDDGGGGDNWTTGAVSHAKLQSNHHHQQTNTQFFYKPDALPVTQPTVSKHWRAEKKEIYRDVRFFHGALQMLLFLSSGTWSAQFDRICLPRVSITGWMKRQLQRTTIQYGQMHETSRDFGGGGVDISLSSTSYSWRDLSPVWPNLTWRHAGY